MEAQQTTDDAPSLEVAYHRPWLYPKQSNAIFCQQRISLVEASTKSGKAQPLDAIVYTPAGPVQMGSLQVGQQVLTVDGGRSDVLAIFPQGIRDIYRVTFSDGTSAEVDRDHLWEVHQFRTRPRVVTTGMLMRSKQKHLRRMWVPPILPVDFDTAPVPLDPYALGLLIGDGGLTTSVIRFSSKDDQIIEALRTALPPGHLLVKEPGENSDWRISAGSRAASHREAGTHLRGILKRIGVAGVPSHEKTIPPIYKYNSVAIRTAVLQGLLDTDGFVDQRHQPGIEQTSAALAKDIEELVQSLGGTVLTSYRATNGYRDKSGTFIQCRPVYRQSIRFTDATWCFRLERKRRLVRPKLKSGSRMFRSIEWSRAAPAQCIKISHPRQLYLTDGFIPTHNTVACIAWLVEQAMLGGGSGRNYWWVAPVGTQSDIAFTRTLNFLPRDSYNATRAPTKIVLLNGAVIWFKSSDRPDGLYGDDVYAAVLDEASRMKEAAWHAVRSTLTFTKGPVRIIGNVKGRRNWFYHLSRRAEEGRDPDLAFHRIDAYDAVAASVLDAKEIESAKRDLPEQVFRELYLAQPSDDGGNPFGIEHIRGCILTPATQVGVPAHWGWDLAKRQDYTVGIALDAAGYVCRLERFQHIPWDQILDNIIKMTGSTPALVDSTGVGDPIVDFLQKKPGTHFEGYHFNPASKQKLMEGLSVAIQSRSVGYPDGVIVTELEQFEYVYSRIGVRYSAPDGGFDDCVCALALAQYHRASRPPSFVVSPAMLQAAISQSQQYRRRY